jgi:hypothetical protein
MIFCMVAHLQHQRSRPRPAMGTQADAQLDAGGVGMAQRVRHGLLHHAAHLRRGVRRHGAIQHFGGDVPFERNAQAVERRPQPVAQVPQPLEDGGAALVVQVVDGHLELEQAGLQRDGQAVGARGLRVLARQQGHQPGAHAVVQVVGDATALGHHRLRLAPLGHAAQR